MSQARSFTIELTQVGTGKKATVKVNQAGFTPEYTFLFADTSDNKPLTLNNTYDYAGNYTINIVSKKSTLNASTPFIPLEFKVDALNNNNTVRDVSVTPEKISFAINKNSTYSERSETLTLTQVESNKTLTIVIKQEAKADDGIFKADPTALSFGASSETKSSKITSTSKGQTVGWTVSNKSSMPSWLTISGEGTGTLSANVKDNA